MDKYEEALAKARAGKSLEEIFPELKESEDEMIRKGLIKDFRNYYEMYDKSCGEPKWGFDSLKVKDILAWLEKQKEQTEELSTRLNGLMQEYVKSGKDEQEQEHRLKCYQLFWDALGDSEFFEQFKEQKPAECIPDSVKFEEGFKTGRELGFREGVESVKPAEWSEEDRNMLNSILFHFNTPFHDMNDVEKKMFTWLQSLPERFSLQPKQEWIEEDEKLLDFWLDVIDRNDWRMDEDFCKASREFINRLKSLRPQPKAELTLLDENIINAAVAFVEQNNHFNCWRGIDKHTVIKALRSLKPHWKPSEEQMEALDNARFCKAYDRTELDSLYEQLNKIFYL